MYLKKINLLQLRETCILNHLHLRFIHIWLVQREIEALAIYPGITLTQNANIQPVQYLFLEAYTKMGSVWLFHTEGLTFFLCCVALKLSKNLGALLKHGALESLCFMLVFSIEILNKCNCYYRIF